MIVKFPSEAKVEKQSMSDVTNNGIRIKVMPNIGITFFLFNDICQSFN